MNLPINCDENSLKILKSYYIVERYYKRKGFKRCMEQFKRFYGGTFLDKEELMANGIFHPIKLEYYKTIKETKDFLGTNVDKYGIQVVKTEYINKTVKIETKEISYRISNEQKIDEILEILKNNKVTPTGAEDIVEDFLKKEIYLSIGCC